MQDYLVFREGKDRTNEVYVTSVTPPAFVQATLLPWFPVNNDRAPLNYQLINGAITYAPPPPPVVVTPANMDLFFELFAKETMLGTFTPKQHGTMKLLADIKQDVAFRDQVLLQAVASGTDAQKSKLFDIAQAAGVKLPFP